MTSAIRSPTSVGAGTDAYTSYTQRGALHVNTHTLDAICELFPTFRRMRMMRNWGGIVDVTPDRSPIIEQARRRQTVTAQSRDEGERLAHGGFSCGVSDPAVRSR